MTEIGARSSRCGVGSLTAVARISCLPRERRSRGLSLPAAENRRSAGCIRVSCHSVLISRTGLDLGGLCPHGIHAAEPRAAASLIVPRRVMRSATVRLYVRGVGYVCMQTLVEDRAYTTLIYGQGEAARIIQAPPTSFARWAHGHRFAQRPASSVGARAAVGVTRRTHRRFGASRGFIIEVFRLVGLPMASFGDRSCFAEDRSRATLLSERLRADGAEILYQNGQGELVVVRNHQGVFNEVVAEFLQSNQLPGWFAQHAVAIFEAVDVVVDPHTAIRVSPQWTGSACASRTS